MIPGNTTSERMAAALRSASDTRELRIGEGVIAATATIFRQQFGADRALLVADANTMAAAGRQVASILQSGGIQVYESLIFEERNLHARMEHVAPIQRLIAHHGVPAIAVGSGTINDLTKLASHRCDRPYMAVATAASMDGYTAFGASINEQGSKQTFFCPAPRAVIADLGIICNAPAELNAAGYADLTAKVTAGADWLLADALGVEPIDPQAWSLVHANLRQWISDPAAVRIRKREALAGITEGLMMTGLAMQWNKSSRPASGAEHQFSHLWDMQDHHHHGCIPLHGYKVAIGTLASTMLYEQLLNRPIESLDVTAVCHSWPTWDEARQRVRAVHSQADLQAVALREMREKHVDRTKLAELLTRLTQSWPALRGKLREQLIPADTLRRMLRQAGAPTTPDEIGIDLVRMRQSYIEAQHIRRRFTVLDLAVLTGWMEECLERIFSPNGPWSAKADSE